MSTSIAGLTNLEAQMQTNYSSLHVRMLQKLAPTELAKYGEYVHGFTPAPHHRLWCDLLEDRTLQRLLIVAPPDHAKTTWVSVVWPAWEIGRNPALHFGHVCNTATQAQANSIAVRDTITDKEVYKETFPGVKPDYLKGWANHRWYLQRNDPGDKDPSYVCAGLYGPILGRRFGLGLLDDIMDEENSATELQREKVQRWISTTFMSRILPSHEGGRAVAVMTRWHERDVARWMAEQGWVVVHMPMRGYGGKALCPFCAKLPPEQTLHFERSPEMVHFEQGMLQYLRNTTAQTGQPSAVVKGANASPVFPRSATTKKPPAPVFDRGTDAGGPPPSFAKQHHQVEPTALPANGLAAGGPLLWPERIGPEQEAEKRLTLGTLRFEGMCQGNPHVPAGEIIKRAWWRETDRLPGGYLHVVQIWDTGYTENKGSSYSVCGTFALMPGAVLVLQWFREKLEWTRLLPQAYLQYKRALDAGLQVNAVKVEPKASGISFVQAVVTGQGRRPGWPHVPITLLPAPVQDKVLRAQSITGYMEAGWVQYLRGAPFAYDLIEECAQFPNGQYNDQVDVLVHALRYLLMGVGQDEEATFVDDALAQAPAISEELDAADEVGFGVL